MDDIQTWWEVPTVALFCNVFRTAFNLFYIGIEELEAAILDGEDPDASLSLEQLIIRLLQGCYEEGEVTSNNWEEKLQELFDEYGEKDKNAENVEFVLCMSPRSKVEVLLKLCEYRIDAGGDLEAIKDIPSEDMQAKCVGKDSQNNTYWYFCDERLYKELPASTVKSGKRDFQGNAKGTKQSNNKNGTRTSAREKKSVKVESSPWSVECFNINEWEAFSKKLSKSKSAAEQELGKNIKKIYIPLLTEKVAEKDQMFRKRLLEMQPKRSSSRICKVQAQRKLEKQLAEEAAEQKRAQLEKEEAEKEAKRKEEERNSRRKRAEERERKTEERSMRVQKRDMMSGKDYIVMNQSKSLHGLSPDENSSSNQNDERDSSSDESENDTSKTFLNSGFNIRNTLSVRGERSKQKVYGQSRFVTKSHESKKRKVDPEDIDMLRNSDVKSYNMEKNLRTYQRSHTQLPFRQRNLNSCTKVTVSPSVIRLDFIKSPMNSKLSNNSYYQSTVAIEQGNSSNQ